MQNLVQFYRKYNLVQSGLDDKELESYFVELSKRGNVIIEKDLEDNVIGFCEFWRINYEQLGRYIIHGLLDARVEDTIKGKICFIANTAVHPDYRNTDVLSIMKNKLFITNYDCLFIVGDSRRKPHHQTMNVYKRTEAMSKLREVKHG